MHINAYAISMTPCGPAPADFDAVRFWLRAAMPYAVERRLVVAIENDFDMLAAGALQSEL